MDKALCLLHLHHNLVCQFRFPVFVSKSVMSLNGQSFVSATPAPQSCVPVLVVM